MICYRNFTSTLCGEGFPCEQEEVERMNHCAVTNVDLGCFDLVKKQEKGHVRYQGQQRSIRPMATQNECRSGGEGRK